MSYTAERTTVGFEFNYHKFGFSGNPVPYELKPDQAFKKGQLVALKYPGQAATDCGKLIPFTDSQRIDQDILVGVMAETIKQADNPSDEVTYGMVYDNPGNIYRVTFTNVEEIQGASDGTTTRLDLAAVTNANNIRGTLMFIYEGPGAGHVRTITEADDGGNTISWIGAIDSITTDETKALLLSADVNSAGINVGSVGAKVDSDGMKVDVGQALSATQNPIRVVRIDPKHLMMDVMLNGTFLGL